MPEFLANTRKNILKVKLYFSFLVLICITILFIIYSNNTTYKILAIPFALILAFSNYTNVQYEIMRLSNSEKIYKTLKMQYNISK